jgi:hypothetical protein
MTCDAGSLVEDGAESVLDGFRFLEDRLSSLEQRELIGAEARKRVAERSAHADLLLAQHVRSWIRQRPLGAAREKDGSNRKDEGSSVHGSSSFRLVRSGSKARLQSCARISNYVAAPVGYRLLDRNGAADGGREFINASLSTR